MATPRAPRAAPTWTFAARFRRGAFGWKSDRAIERLDEAAAEIRAMVRQDPVLAADGAVRLIEKLSPAFENVDDSSGRLQAVIRDVFEQFVPLIGTVEVAPKTREAWLERLWQAMVDDEMPWIERLGDHWGTLCGSPEVASAWADELLPGLRAAWAPSAKGHGWYSGTIPCLSSLYAAGRHAELLALLESAKNVVPTSISTAEAIVAESEDVRTRAQHEAQRLVSDAHTRSDETIAGAEAKAAELVARAERQGEELVADERVVHLAEQRAREIVAEARAEAARLADQANSYCDDRLAAFEADLATLAKQVAGGREAVAQRRATAAEDLEKAHAAAAEARRRGTEEDPARQGARPGADDSHPDTHPEDPEHR